MSASDPAQLRPHPSVLVAHPSAELYGSDRVMLDTVVALVARGWAVTVTLPQDGPLAAEVAAVGATVRLCVTPVVRKSALRPAGLVAFVLTILRSIRPGLALVRSSQPDVVYVSTVTAPLWILLARIRRVKVLCHVHEAEVAAPMIVKRAMAAPLLLVACIVANSEFSLDVLAQALPRLRRRSRVVPNPVPGPPAVVEARAELVEPVRVLYVGRLSPRKGPQHVVDAVAELRTRGVDCQLDLLGSVFPGYEWFEEELHATVAELGLDDQVRFLGFRSDVWPEITATDLVVVPSVSAEPFGNTAVEAVLAARPVVASASGGLLEAISGFRSAQSVPPADASAIADAVQRVILDWAGFRDDALLDASVAAERHSRERYGNRIDAELRTLTPCAPSTTRGST